MEEVDREWEKERERNLNCNEKYFDVNLKHRRNIENQLRVRVKLSWAVRCGCRVECHRNKAGLSSKEM